MVKILTASPETRRRMKYLVHEDCFLFLSSVSFQKTFKLFLCFELLMIPPLLHIILFFFTRDALGMAPYPGWEKYDPVYFMREKEIGAGLRFDCWVGDLLTVLYCANFMTAFKSPSIASWLKLLALPRMWV